MARSVIAELLKIYKASYTAVLPDKIIKKCVTYDAKSEVLRITGDKYNLQSRNVYVVGAGKAVQFMARELDTILGSKITQGIVSIPHGSLCKDTKDKKSNLNFCMGAKNNLPDEGALTAAKNVKDLASNLKESDLLLILVSGGGSALLPIPKEPITLDEKTQFIKQLANAGADIKELNIVRKKISEIKGGKLAIAANPAIIVTLVLSDIVGDPLDLIASGPTVEDPDDIQSAIQVIEKYNLYEQIPASIKKVLESDVRPQIEFPRDRVINYILGSNKESVFAAQDEAKDLKYVPIVLTRKVTGNVTDLAREYVKLAKMFSDFLNRKLNIQSLKQEVSLLNIPGIDEDFTERLVDVPNAVDICLILAGEPTVEVKGSGKGGRNQQLALEFSVNIHKEKAEFQSTDVYILSAGTDGIDGPTDAAGAIGYLDLVSDCEKANIDVQSYIDNNDSYNFYKEFKTGTMHVITGHTQTNVMDIHLIVIKKSK